MIAGFSDSGFMKDFFERHQLKIVTGVLSVFSFVAFVYYYQNGLGIAYNDARSHLDIGRRVVDGLNPGIAQLGSVWLPLTHILMTATIWNDFMWHSGLAGAIQSMAAYVVTGVLIFLFLKELGIGILGRLAGVVVFALNPNMLYLQSTAMTEPMFIVTMMAGFYSFLLWYKRDKLKFLIITAFWIMLSTLVRYDGWFLFFLATVMIAFSAWKKRNWRNTEGNLFIFCALGGLGIVLWLLWNLLIFGDPLYFAFGPYSAHSQQLQLETEGSLHTKGDWFFSAEVYFYTWLYNVGATNLALSLLGMIALFFSRKIPGSLRYASLLLFAPLLFNILALYLGHSVIHIIGISGGKWFNVRYGVLMLPSIAIFIGVLVSALRWRYLQMTALGLLLLSNFLFATKSEAVSVEDARYGESQKNVGEVSVWLREHVATETGFILISTASHDSIVFSSGLPMKRFIHEGAGGYYAAAIADPSHWARYIVVRSFSENDSTWRLLKDNEDFQNRYDRVGQYPFADIYQLKKEYLGGLNTKLRE